MPYLEDHPRTRTWLVLGSPPFIAYYIFRAFGRGPTTWSLGDENDHHGYCINHVSKSKSWDDPTQVDCQNFPAVNLPGSTIFESLTGWKILHHWANGILFYGKGRLFDCYVGVSKNKGVSPQIMNFSRVFHYKPSMLGYPYFWKHLCFFTCRVCNYCKCWLTIRLPLMELLLWCALLLMHLGFIRGPAR